MYHKLKCIKANVNLALKTHASLNSIPFDFYHLRSVSVPRSEKIRFTNAGDAGAESRSSASFANRGEAYNVDRRDLFNPFLPIVPLLEHVIYF